MEIKTEIIIQASAERIWNVLVDFANYNTWNPFVHSLKGDVAERKYIEVLLGPDPKKAMKFRPLVQEFKTNKVFQWKGQLFFKGIFDGTHRFEIIELHDGTCKFVHSEKFSGILVPFLKKMLLNETQPGFEAMNLALKKKVERLP